MNPVPFAMIRAVRENVDLLILVGGGINTIQKASIALEADADTIVVGHGIEKDLNLIDKIGNLVCTFNLKKPVENC